YIVPICNQLFQLYRDFKARSFVLQFLPTFLSTYYNVLYEKDDETKFNFCIRHDKKKKVKFVVSDYDVVVKVLLMILSMEKLMNVVRVPNLALPSVYHVPHPDQYAPIPLTQTAISKHENICEMIRLQTFIPFDSANATT
ncbi:unnamed protein product, partial [Didymodactylos carnosus]